MKDALIRTLGLLLLLVGFVSNASAQNDFNRFGLGMFLSTYEYQGDLGSEYFQFRDVQGGGGISLNYYISSSMDLGLGVQTGSLNYFDESFRVKAGLISTNFDLKFKFYNGKLIKEDAFIGPYVIVGAGISDIRSEGVNMGYDRFRMEKVDFNISFGIGVKFRMNDNLSFVAQCRQYKPMQDDFDGNDGADSYLESSIGLIFNPIAIRDGDEDGIPDYRDKCPNTKKDVVVDKHGCPLDSDGDGIADYIDSAPLLPGGLNIEENPDLDGDGVPNAIDYCPNEPGSEKFNGCPDSDDDGIVDIYDQCPDTEPGVLVNYKGCPRDYDRDGIPDIDDHCPKIKGIEAYNGCPDPTTVVEKRVIQKEVNVKGFEKKQPKTVIKNQNKKTIIHEKVKLAAESVNFEFASNTLTPSSKLYLRELAKILKSYPEVSITINGHTDSKGSEEWNELLSQQRADVARAYLIAQGVESRRLKSVGYGESKPVAGNGTASGRAMNRRVEFEVFY
jgi:OmpA-OmpF porin, OOP family